MNKEIIAKSKAQIKNKWFKTKEDELDIALNIIDELEQQCKKQKEVIDKAVEYITSYESISTIQGLTHAEDNKQLDEKTMVEMTNRYLLVHDKLLQILEEEK